MKVMTMSSVRVDPALPVRPVSVPPTELNGIQMPVDLRSRLLPGVRLLLDGYRYAVDLGVDRWRFALEIGVLHKFGLTDNDLRWLAGKGFVVHADGNMQADRKARPLAGSKPNTLSKGTRFILTDRGLEWAMAGFKEPAPLHPSSSSPVTNGDHEVRADVPTWYQDLHTLCWQGRVVKHFQREAPCQETILTVFQTAQWKRYVTVVLPAESVLKSKSQLHQAIKDLNRSCRQFLHFFQEGNGARVGWQPAS